MIISGARQEFNGSCILMPAFSLAPLYLQQGARCWVAHGKAKSPRKSKTYEVIISSVSPSLWPDLWKLKLTTIDEIGIARELTELLASKRIEIVTSESSVHSLNRYNSMSYVLSLSEYRDPIDGDIALRARTSQAAYLEHELMVRMCDKLVFLPSGQPRFELAPMTLYWQLAEGKNFGFYHSPKELIPVGAEGEIALPASVLSNIREHSGEDLYYAAAVDTENRVIRVLFFPKGQTGIAHMQFASRRMTSRAIARIMELLSDRQANILRFQIRRGLNACDTPKFGRLYNSMKGKPNPGRVDVTFESIDPKVPTSKLINLAVRATKDDPILKEHNVDITKTTL